MNLLTCKDVASQFIATAEEYPILIVSAYCPMKRPDHQLIGGRSRMAVSVAESLIEMGIDFSGSYHEESCSDIPLNT